MASIRVLILRAAGTNCDLETQWAWELAGARAERMHIRRLIERPDQLDAYQILTIPGGFSYGDDIAAGRIFAAQIERHLRDRVRRFIDAGKLVLGICNGFQVLARSGLLPYPSAEGRRRVCSITGNDPPGFQDRWVRLRANDTACVFLEPGREYELPIAHAEGRVLFADTAARRRLVQHAQHALCYAPPADANGAAPNAPYNPNGSELDIAGLCDPSGRVLGLMPHPERFVTRTQHPCWTSRPPRESGDGLAFFQQAVACFA